MALSVVTRGYGSFGSASLVITRGFTPGINVVVPTSSDGGGPNKRHLNYLTKAEKKKIDEITALLEAELHNIPVQAKTATEKADVAKAEKKIRRYKTQLIRLDPHLGNAIDGLVQIVLQNRQKAEADRKLRQRERNKKALLMLLNG